MNTNSIPPPRPAPASTTEILVVLQDGHSQLAQWAISSDERPSLDDSVEIPAQILAGLTGFEPQAVVKRIEIRTPLPDRIHLEAICRIRAADRPMILLNSARIAASRRADTEAFLRSKLEFPLIYWEASNTSTPVLRFHDPVSGNRQCPEEIQAGVIPDLPNPIGETTADSVNPPQPVG